MSRSTIDLGNELFENYNENIPGNVEAGKK